MSRILITGGTGYIGSCFIKYLLAGQKAQGQILKDTQVYCLARKPFNTMYLRLEQDKVHWCEYDGSLQSVKVALYESKPDLVYHLATFFTKGHGEKEIPLLIQANLELGCNLVEAMSKLGGGRLIYTSSVTEYGQDGSYCPATLYAAMKRAFLDIAQFYVKEGALKLGHLVLTDTYGPQDMRPKVMNILKQAILQGSEMQFSSTGEQIFDLVYIDDVVNALYLLGQHLMQDEGEGVQHYQVFADNPLSLKETVQVFVSANQLECKVSWAESGAQAEHKLQSQPQAVRVFPRVPRWQERVGLREGMQRFFKQ